MNTHLDADAPFEEHVLAVKGEPSLHLDTNPMSMCHAVTLKRPADVTKSFREVVYVAQKLEDTVPVFGLGFDSCAMKDVDRGAVSVVYEREQWAFVFQDVVDGCHTY